MCGIAGCYQRHDGPLLARAMADLLAHRGPDAHGAYDYESEDVRCTLAHRRLSIIDLSDAATQPFTKDGLSLVYNGELYNYRELRAELDAAGFASAPRPTPRSCSRRGGTSGPRRLTRFRGMFAFAIFDERTRQPRRSRATSSASSRSTTCGRRDGSVVFASELKAIATTVGHELEVDLATLVASMLYYWVPDQRCAFRERAQAAAGNLGRVPPRRNRADPAVLVDRRSRARPRRGTPGRPRSGHRGLGRRAHRRRRSRLDVPRPAGSTRASSACSPRGTTRRSTRTRSRSGPRTSAARRCPTTRSTRARSPRATASPCTRSRSHPTSPTCCRAWSTCSTNRSAIRPRSTRCSSAKRRATRA